MQLYPLKGIFPNINEYDYTFQSNKLFKNEVHIGKQVNSKYYPYLLNQIQRNYFYQTDKERLYILKVESDEFQSIGLIAKLNINEIKNILYLHEETISIKVQNYINDLLIYNILISPVILSHNESYIIDTYLKNVIESPISIEIKDDSSIYKIWEIHNNELVKDLFIREVDYLFLADGHHRLEALEKSNKKFLYAYILSNKYLKSQNIYRVYENITENRINKLIDLLVKIYNPNKSKTIYSYIENNTYSPILTHNNDNYIFDAIKNYYDLKGFLNKVYTYLNKDLNFINYSQLPDFESHARKLCIYIPKIEIAPLRAIGPMKFPPHSSYFDPKIPGGLLSILL